ncbi:MAG: hypothetical protein GXO75_15390 [Calditrichaeota bacterium]|nr:hypothetical protein [Calditrichota bacterium]
MFDKLKLWLIKQIGGVMLKKILGEKSTYIMFVLAVAVVFGWVTGYLSEEITVTLIGLLGFAGLAGLRQFIDSSGYKTYILAFLGVVGVLLQVFFDWFTPDMLGKWLMIWGLLGGATLTHAVAKEKKLKKR